MSVKSLWKGLTPSKQSSDVWVLHPDLLSGAGVRDGEGGLDRNTGTLARGQTKGRVLMIKWADAAVFFTGVRVLPTSSLKKGALGCVCSQRELVQLFYCPLVAKSCLTCDPMDCSPPGSSLHRVSQARILEGIAISLGGIFKKLILRYNVVIQKHFFFKYKFLV